MLIDLINDYKNVYSRNNICLGGRGVGGGDGMMVYMKIDTFKNYC